MSYNYHNQKLIFERLVDDLLDSTISGTEKVSTGELLSEHIAVSIKLALSAFPAATYTSVLSAGLKVLHDRCIANSVSDVAICLNNDSFLSDIVDVLKNLATLPGASVAQNGKIVLAPSIDIAYCMSISVPLSLVADGSPVGNFNMALNFFTTVDVVANIPILHGSPIGMPTLTSNDLGVDQLLPVRHAVFLEYSSIAWKHSLPNLAIAGGATVTGPYISMTDVDLHIWGRCADSGNKPPRPVRLSGARNEMGVRLALSLFAPVISSYLARQGAEGATPQLTSLVGSEGAQKITFGFHAEECMAITVAWTGGTGCAVVDGSVNVAVSQNANTIRFTSDPVISINVSAKAKVEVAGVSVDIPQWIMDGLISMARQLGVEIPSQMARAPFVHDIDCVGLSLKDVRIWDDALVIRMYKNLSDTGSAICN